MCPDRTVLSAYLDGELQDRWRNEVEAHLQGCASCAARLAGLRSLSGTLADAPVPDVDQAMARVRAALAGLPARIPSRWRSVTLPVPLALAAAALVVVLGAALAYTLVRAPSDPQQFTASSLVVEADAAQIGRLLDLLNAQAGERTVVIEIPSDYSFSRFGEPQFRPATQRSSE